MIRGKRFARAAAIAFALAACRERPHAVATTGSSAAVATASAPTPPPSPASDPLLPRSDRDLPTTSASIFFGNLDGQIARAEMLAARDPKSATVRRDLGVILYARAKFKNDLLELATAREHLAKAIALDPNDPSAYLARANQLQTVHRFPEARLDLERARALGATPADVEAIEVELDYVQGAYDKSLPALRRMFAENKSSAAIARHALLEHDLGHYEEADKLFSEAEANVRDPSPVPVAWLNLQRGVHCHDAGQPERAVTFFREAIRRIPGYIAAEEHLAETLHELGKTEEATKLYEGIVQRSGDPEFKGALSLLYRERGNVAEADALVKRAALDYEALLKTNPAAMYWHASEFFLGAGKDPKRARALLRKNVELRPGATSLVALARAELANGGFDEARTAIRKALATPLVSADMYWTAARIERALGTRGAATSVSDFEGKARALNPRIGDP